MLLAYPIYYRKFGVRRAQQFAFGKFFGLDEFAFPRNSLFHYYNAEPLEHNLAADSMYLQGFTKRFFIEYESQLKDPEGFFRQRRLNLPTMVRPFLRENTQHFKYIRDVEQAPSDINALVIVNYNYIKDLYIYNKNLIAPYYAWKNIQKTIYLKAQETAQKSDRNQFVFINLDAHLPSWSSFNVFSKRTTPNLLKLFKTAGLLNLLDLFKWINPLTRQDSILNLIDKEHYSKINFVFFKDGRWVDLNLDYLYQWIEPESGEKIKGVASYPSLIVQKLFLKFLINLQSVAGPELDLIEAQASEVTVQKGSASDEEQEAANVEDQNEDELGDDDENEQSGEPADRTAPSKASQHSTHQSEIAPVQVKSDEVVFEDDNDIDKIISDIDKDLKELEEIEKKQMADRGIKLDEEEGNVVQEPVAKPQITHEEVRAEVFTVQSESQMLKDQVDAYADYDVLSAADYRQIKKAIEKSEQLVDPYGTEQKLIEAKKIQPEEVSIEPEKNQLFENTENLQDPSMAKSSIKQYEQKYIKKILPKDILASVSSVQRAGIILEDYTIDRKESILGSFEEHTVKLRPIDGKPSTVRFKIPVVEEDGTFMDNGNKLILRKQRTDLPIRKIKPTIVALSSYYGKTFIERSGFERYKPEVWIAKQLQLLSESQSSDIVKLYPANVYNNYFEAPYMYNALATQFKSILLKKMVLEFDYRWPAQHFTPELLAEVQKDGRVICGATLDKHAVVMDSRNNLFVYKEKKLEPLGTIYEVLGLAEQNSPLDFASVRIFAKMIPIGFILAYYLGFDKLLALMNAKYRVVESKRAGALAASEWKLTFEDRIYIFDRRQELVTLVLSGFLQYKDSLKTYEYDAFNKKDVYFNVLENQGISSIYLKEIDNQRKLFIDPITREILETMKEPQTYEGLLVRSVEMLLNFNHPAFQDLKAMRIRGYERVAGIVYKELAHAIRDYSSKSIRGKSQIQLNPFAVWKTIRSDNSAKIVEDINPIQNLKENEAVTYLGEGGRNRDTLAKDTRAYHKTDVGVISEATIDSGDVGINAYLSANPKFKTIRGLVDFDTKDKDNISNLLSTSALISAGSQNDDPIRVNFISIQQAHTVAAQGYRQPYIQTGYENVLPYRTSSLFAYMAEDDGRVVDLNEHGIVVEYKKLGRKGVYLGRQYGKAEGSVYPHDIVTPLNLNDTFKKSDPIAYNSGFFEPDFLDPKRIIYKGNLAVRTALYETSQTLEDASSISKKLSDKLTAKTTKIKTYTVDFKEGIRQLVKVGQAVEPTDILFLIESETTANTDVFDEKSADILKRLSAHAPRSKVRGVIDRIEVFYHGDKDDMSPSLKKVADESDKMMRARHAAVVEKSSQLNGAVDQDYRIAGKPLQLDTAEIRIYITLKTKAAIGDKGVFANQMKSIFSEVLDYDMRDQDGQDIDAVFGYRSISARIVLSPVVIGTSITLLKAIAKQAVSLYEGQS